MLPSPVAGPLLTRGLDSGDIAETQLLTTEVEASYITTSHNKSPLIMSSTTGCSNAWIKWMVKSRKNVAGNGQHLLKTVNNLNI